MVCWDPTSAARPRDLDHWIWRGCSVLDGYPSVLMLPKKTTFLCHYHMFSVRAVHRYLKSAKGWLCCDVESSSFHMAPFLCATIWTHPHLCQHTAPVVEGTTVLYCIMWYSYVQILLWMVSEKCWLTTKGSLRNLMFAAYFICRLDCPKLFVVGRVWSTCFHSKAGWLDMNNRVLLHLDVCSASKSKRNCFLKENMYPHLL